MIEVKHNLWVGNQADCIGLTDFAIVHACKEPYHRQFVGYKQRALPKDHEEYLWAIRGNEIALNIIDADSKEYFAEEMIGMALNFIDTHLYIKNKVLVHCNQGQSRSPSIAMLYMRDELPDDFEEAEEAFRLIYPAYKPKNGIRGYVREHWKRPSLLKA
jgi:predicted protein tyrosine phosphatase